MINVFRFSRDGFVPKTQTHHHNNLLAWRNPPDLTNLNEYQRGLVLESYNKNRPLLDLVNLDDWCQGVFVFAGQLPELRWVNLMLNHLSAAERMARVLYKAELPEEAEVYSNYGLIPQLFRLGEYLERYSAGCSCYLPSRTLKFIRNSHEAA